MPFATRSKLTLLSVALASLAAIACGDGARISGGGVTVRDSSGIEIVEHSAAYIAALPAWTLDTAPLIHIAGDAPGNAFTRINAAIRRSDGRIIVVEGRAVELREYSAAGEFERILARSGRGPGEIAFISKLQLTPEDSLIVFDTNQRRASVFAPNGAFVRQVTYPRLADGSTFAARSMLNDKRLLGTLKKPLGELVATDGPVTRIPYAIVRMADPNASGDSTATVAGDTVAIVPDLEAYPVAFPSEGKVYPDRDFMIFGRRTNIAESGDVVFVGTNVTGEIDQYNGNHLVRHIRSNVVPAAVTEADRESVRDGIRASFETLAMPADEKAAVLNHLLTKRRIADVFPFSESLTVGTDGTLWVEEPRVRGTAGRKYVVHDSTGRAIAHVTFPERIVPHGLSREKILGVWTDGDDVPHVMVWRVVPAGVGRND